MKKLLVLLAFALAVLGCPTGPVDLGVPEASTTDAAPPHKLGFTPTNPLSVGSGTFATVGDLRVPNVSQARARDVGNTKDLVIWQTDTNNFLNIGGDNVQTATSQFNSTQIAAAASGTINLVIGGATQLQANSSGVAVFATGGALTFGNSGAAASGLIRLPNAGVIKARDVGNTTEYSLLTLDSSNYATFGNPAGGGYIQSLSNGVDMIIGPAFRISSTQITTGLPIVGNAQPYSVHGKVTVATTGSFSLAAAAYAFDAIMLSGGTAGTVTFPSVGSDAVAYYKTVINTSGVTKTLTDGGASTPALTTGLTGHYLCDTAGMHLTGATVAYP